MYFLVTSVGVRGRGPTEKHTRTTPGAEISTSETPQRQLLNRKEEHYLLKRELTVMDFSSLLGIYVFVHVSGVIECVGVCVFIYLYLFYGIIVY